MLVSSHRTCRTWRRSCLNLIDASGDHPQAFALHLLVVGSNKLNPRGSSLGVTVKDIIEFDS